MKESCSIVYRRHGDPLEVLEMESRTLPQPGPGEVRVRLLAACLHPSDAGMIAGSYGRLRELPAVAGREGVGTVDAVGAGVDGVETGQRVRFPEAGAWREHACCKAAELQFIPAGVPVELAAQSFINPPTAWCLLRQMVDLPKGAWIVQNAGNSAVGLSVIQLAREMGCRTISEVRRESLSDPLKGYGADAVVQAGSSWHKRVDEITGGEPVRLALNSVGGSSALEQIRALGEGGTQVTFGGMARELVRFPTRELIFKDVRLAGFWWDRWARENGMEARDAILRGVHQRMREGRLRLPVAEVYPLDQYKEALARAGEPRLGKVLLSPDPAGLREEEA